jgi:chloramphenicol 3-O phosphotransferase
LIILLNGTSSSGKSSIAQVLQLILPRPFLRAGIDHFSSMLPPNFVTFDPGIQTHFRENLPWANTNTDDRITTRQHAEALADQWRFDMRRTIAFMASLGHHLIVEDILIHQRWVEHYRQLLAPYPVVWVGVHCALETARLRERERGGQGVFPGQAEQQFDRVHQWCDYDQQVDSDLLSPYQCAQCIAQSVVPDLVTQDPQAAS